MVIINLKGFQETLHSGMCGPASLKIVLDYYGITKSEQELAVLTEKDVGGVDDTRIAKAAKSLGFQVVIENNSSFESVQRWLEKGVPVIVDWFTRGRPDYSDSEVADGHYSVASGLDDTFIYLQDPEIGKLRKIKKDDFVKVWFDFSGKIPNEGEFIIRQLIAIYK